MSVFIREREMKMTPVRRMEKDILQTAEDLNQTEIRVLVDRFYQAQDNRKRRANQRSEEHTSELQSQSTSSYAVVCLKKKKNKSNFNTQMQDKAQ